MEVVGIWDRGPMAWQENLLPKMHKRAVEAAKSFLVHVEKGYVKVLITDQSSAFEETSQEELE